MKNVQKLSFSSFKWYVSAYIAIPSIEWYIWGSVPFPAILGLQLYSVPSKFVALVHGNVESFSDNILIKWYSSTHPTMVQSNCLAHAYVNLHMVIIKHTKF
jgi:hypothetical protein